MDEQKANPGDNDTVEITITVPVGRIRSSTRMWSRRLVKMSLYASGAFVLVCAVTWLYRGIHERALEGQRRKIAECMLSIMSPEAKLIAISDLQLVRGIESEHKASGYEVFRSVLPECVDSKNAEAVRGNQIEELNPNFYLGEWRSAVVNDVEAKVLLEDAKKVAQRRVELERSQAEIKRLNEQAEAEKRLLKMVEERQRASVTKDYNTSMVVSKEDLIKLQTETDPLTMQIRIAENGKAFICSSSDLIGQ